MHLNTFPCTVSPIHSTGVTIVSCPALGVRDAHLTDDFGHLQRIHDCGLVAVSMHGSEQVN